MTRSAADVHGGRVDAGIGDLIDAERQRVAAEERRHRHWLRQQAKESGTLAGVLVDMGERAAPVVLSTVGGQQRHGTVSTVGADFVTLNDPAGADHVIDMHAVTSVRPEPGGRASLGDRTIPSQGTFSDVVRRLVDERADAAVTTSDGTQVGGRLSSAGVDVLSIAAGTGELVYLPLAAIVEVVVR